MAHSAGRIWWLAGGARKLIGPQVVNKYTTISAMMYISLNVRASMIDMLSRLESGALYCIGGIAFVIVATYEVSGRIQFNTVGDQFSELPWLNELCLPTDDQRCHIGTTRGPSTLLT
jgi:hypothetical protein